MSDDVNHFITAKGEEASVSGQDGATGTRFTLPPETLKKPAHETAFLETLNVRHSIKDSGM